MKSMFRIILKISLILTILAGCATTEEINETDPDSHLTQGTEYAKKDQNDRSIADFNKAIELNRRDAMPYFNRGFVYGEKGRYDKAISDYNEAIELNPGFSEAYINRAYAYE